MMLKVFFLTLIFACVSCDKIATSRVGTKTPRVHDAELDVGFMYWAPATPILHDEWQLVIGGTVMETHRKDGYGAHEEPFTSGTLSVDKIFLNLPTKEDVVSPSLKILKSDVFDGLKVGDKVIVFITEYDGGYGTVEASDSNCKMGIKVNTWDDTIVGAVEKMTRDAQVANDFDVRCGMLDDSAFAELWMPYSAAGIDALREVREFIKKTPSSEKSVLNRS